MPETQTSVIVNVAFLMAAAAFLLRDILHLRLVAMLANLGLIYGAAQHPAWAGAPHLYWYFAFLAINTVQSAILLYERNLLRLSDEEQELRERAFPALDKVAVKRILRRGTWIDLAAGDVLAEEGEIPERVVVLASGVASVSLNDVRVARISPGEFVGEIAFLAGRPATATVVAVEPGRALAWPRDKLARWVQRDAKMHTAMYAAMGQNLAEKMAAADVAMTRT